MLTGRAERKLFERASAIVTSEDPPTISDRREPPAVVSWPKIFVARAAPVEMTGYNEQ